MKDDLDDEAFTNFMNNINQRLIITDNFNLSVS